jgi:carbon monoxide dehydrogenase subunit G
MALHFEGDKDFPQPPAVLWEKLSDARFLVTCIPDVESVATVEPRLAVCKVRPGFGFVRGSLDLTLTIADAEPLTSIHLTYQTRGIGTTSTVDSVLTLTPQGTGTRLHWVAEVKELGGLLKAVPQGLLRAAGQKVITDSWNAVEAKLAQEASPPA